MTTQFEDMIAANVISAEDSLRQGSTVEVLGRSFSFKGSRFFVDGKRFSTVSDARQALQDAFEAEYGLVGLVETHGLVGIEFLASYTANNTIADGLDENAADSNAITVKHAATLLNLSEVRIRRMVKEGKLRYVGRSMVNYDGVQQQVERRARSWFKLSDNN